MIIYLHGFASSPRSHKARWFREHLSHGAFHAPAIPRDPARAMPFLEGVISDARRHHGDEACLLVGSSLGGFYAQYLGREQAVQGVVLINPALEPEPLLRPLLGEVRDYHTGEPFQFETRHLEALRAYRVPEPCRRPVPTLVLLDAGDAVIDSREAASRYTDCATVVHFPGGHHGFAHLDAALPAIEAFHGSLCRSRAGPPPG